MTSRHELTDEERAAREREEEIEYNKSRIKVTKRNRYWHHLMASEVAEAETIRSEFIDEYGYDPSSFEYGTGKNMIAGMRQPDSFHVIFNRERSIVVFKEKHGDRYFDITESAGAAGAFLTILKERSAPDYCWYSDTPELEEGETVDQFDLWHKPRKSDLQTAKDIITMAEDKSKLLLAGWSAYNFLESMRDGEYEGFEFVDYCPVDEEFELEEK